MSIYADACHDLALECITKCSTFGMAYSDYITGLELHELAVAERAKFDPEHPERYRGSQRAWDALVWQIARDAWKDAMAEAGRPGLMELSAG